MTNKRLAIVNKILFIFFIFIGEEKEKRFKKGLARKKNITLLNTKLKISPAILILFSRANKKQCAFSSAIVKVITARQGWQ
jgi:hypothetical protein